MRCCVLRGKHSCRRYWCCCDAQSCCEVTGSAARGVETLWMCCGRRRRWNEVQRAARKVRLHRRCWWAGGARVRCDQCAAGKTRSEVAGAARECVACAGVRNAWGQSWCYGGERALVPTATEALPNGDTGARAASQRRKKRGARSKGLHVELVLLRLCVCKCRSRHCASVGGVAVDVADEFAAKRCSEGRARISRIPALGSGEAGPADGGTGAAEYDRKRAQAGWRR